MITIHIQNGFTNISDVCGGFDSDIVELIVFLRMSYCNCYGALIPLQGADLHLVTRFINEMPLNIMRRTRGNLDEGNNHHNCNYFMNKN